MTKKTSEKEVSKTLVPLPLETKKAAKIEAAKRGISFKELVIQALKAFLSKK